MSTAREELAAVLDPDAFDGDKPKSKFQVAVLQWAARRQIALGAADKAIAAGWKSPAQVEAALAESDKTPPWDRVAVDAIEDIDAAAQEGDEVKRAEAKTRWWWAESEKNRRGRDEAVKQALAVQREGIAAELESMGEIWGGSAAWLTTGTRVANLTAEIARNYTQEGKS